MGSTFPSEELVVQVGVVSWETHWKIITNTNTGVTGF